MRIINPPAMGSNPEDHVRALRRVRCALARYRQALCIFEAHDLAWIGLVEIEAAAIRLLHATYARDGAWVRMEERWPHPDQRPRNWWTQYKEMEKADKRAIRCCWKLITLTRRFLDKEERKQNRRNKIALSCGLRMPALADSPFISPELRHAVFDLAKEEIDLDSSDVNVQEVAQ